MIEFESHKPDVRLTPFIKSYFWCKDDNAPLVQRIVPNGEMGLCIYRRNCVRYSDVGVVTSCLSGQHIHYQDIISDGKVEIVGAHFTVLGAHLFFQLPMGELYGQTINLDDLHDIGLVEVEEQITEASNTKTFWQLFDSFFLKRLEKSSIDVLNFKRLYRAIAYGKQHTFNAKIADIATEACLSQRHFSRIFSDVVGMPPKDYMRLQRYHKALYDLKAGCCSATEVAWNNGFYDFSHLSADFKLISGLSPNQLLKDSTNDDDDVGWRL